MRFYRKVLILCAPFFLLAGCSAIKNSQYEYYLSRKFEVPECDKNYSHLFSRTLSGTAQFYKRGVDLVMQGSNLQNLNLGNPLAAPLAIRFAEIAVYNSAGEIVQCGQTSSSGTLQAIDGSSLLIPAVAGNYTVKVLSRAHTPLAKSPDNIDMFIVVKKDIYTNEVHELAKSFYANTSDDVTDITLLAYARQTDSLSIEGGAFNILNSITTAYQYIQANTALVDTTCLNQKLNVFWQAGFNPRQYVEPKVNPANLDNGSFYIKEEKSLYITGGKLGNVSIEVTNHFDDYVVIHEFGHFVEDVCGRLQSPGGSHSIIARTDPRLAWTEGWANYFAAQVMYSMLTLLNPEISAKFTAASLPAAWTYLFASKGFTDTAQNINNGSGFMFDLKKAGNNPDTWQYSDLTGIPFDRVDPVRYPGEGHFREGAVTRGLFKLTNNCGGTCLPLTSTPISFKKIWQGMDRLTGAGQSAYPFKDSHRVLELVKSSVGTAAWSADYTAFNQGTTGEALHLHSDGAAKIKTGTGVLTVNYWWPYGQSLISRAISSAACAKGINYFQPRTDDPILTSTNSDQRYSNHFFVIDFSLLNSPDQLTDIRVNFTQRAGTVTEFDLLLYEEGYVHTLDYSCAATNSNGACTNWQPIRSIANDVVRSDRRAGNITTKIIRNLNTLDQSKKYLLNIRAYTANKSISTITEYSYTIQDQNNENICP